MIHGKLDDALGLGGARGVRELELIGQRHSVRQSSSQHELLKRHELLKSARRMLAVDLHATYRFTLSV